MNRLGWEPEDAITQLTNLKNDNESLREQLWHERNKPVPGESKEELERLRKDENKWYKERDKYESKIADLNRKILDYKSMVVDQSSSQNYIKTLEKWDEFKNITLQEFDRRLDELTQKNVEKQPFPECSNMDNDEDLQKEPDHDQARKSISLKALPNELSQAIATIEEIPLFFTQSDVRIFLAGLAMSKLIILQGISGTGKTSLPRAFAKVASGPGYIDKMEPIETIEVQAGWRDKQDLIGYYNTFEKKFYESKFTKGLYRSQTPYYQNQIFFILFDEMNLSYFEQYAADIDSAMEQPKEDRKINLTSFTVKPYPKKIERGQILRIPDNVWFVGTANHDETTLPFADKTYDRAHIMELPPQPEKFELPKNIDRKILPYDVLNKAFKDAWVSRASDAEACINFLNEYLAPDLKNNFSVGWGQRLDLHMKKFVPVVTAAGGSKGEAMDHILATKILRKIRERYDTDEESLGNFKKLVEEKWSRIDPDNGPTKSLEIIKNEMNRKGKESSKG